MQDHSMLFVVTKEKMKRKRCVHQEINKVNAVSAPNTPGFKVNKKSKLFWDKKTLSDYEPEDL